MFCLQGKVFPKLRKRIPQGSGSTDSVSDKEEDEATDYVFRILFPNSQSEFGENSIYTIKPKHEQQLQTFITTLLIIYCSERNTPPQSDFFPFPSTEWPTLL